MKSRFKPQRVEPRPVVTNVVERFPVALSCPNLDASRIGPRALLATGLLACYIPARRAMLQVDPVVALRHE